MLTHHDNVRRHPPHTEPLPVEIPHVNFVGAVVGGCFRVQRLKLQGDSLDIYAVTDLRRGDATFEAQAFPLSFPLGKLLESRSRRMKRISRSRNFRCEFNWAGRKFLVSQVVRSEAEWRNLVAANDTHAEDDQSDAEEEFPALPSVRMPAFPKGGQVPLKLSLRRPQQPSQDRSFSTPGRVYPGTPGCLNYAEVAMRGQKLEAQSSTSKGIRQRRRRQRRSQEKRLRDGCQ